MIALPHSVRNDFYSPGQHSCINESNHSLRVASQVLLSCPADCYCMSRLNV